jgi:2-iminobutanoate/2-iminopropanoate deaminase
MSRRKSIEVAGLNHGPVPIPLAAVVDNVLISGGIHAMDPATGKMSDSIEQQCSQLFQNIRLIMEAADGTTEDIVKMTFFVKDTSLRGAINKEWLAMFPEAESRPARHVLIYPLASPMLIQCEIYAVLGKGENQC